MPWLPLAPIAALPSPCWLQFPPLIPPVAAPCSHLGFLFQVIRRITLLCVLWSTVIRGSVLLHRLLAHMAVLVGVFLLLPTPFLLRSVIRVVKAPLAMNPIGLNRHWTTFCCHQSRFLSIGSLSLPSSRARIISSRGISSSTGSSLPVSPLPVRIPS